MHDTNTETPKQYQCRHIFTDGHRCASPCLRQEEFCYYHHTTRKPVANPRHRRSRRSTFHLPLPEDRSAIQSSIGEVLQRIASNEIDPRRAGLLLYGLQIASLNLGKSQPAAKTSAAPETVEEITTDPILGVLAPRAEVSTTATRKSPVALLIEKMIRQEQEKANSQDGTVLPTLQATIDTLTQDDSPARSHAFLKRCDIRPKSDCLHYVNRRKSLGVPSRLIMPICMETVPPEEALSLDQNDATTPRSKPDALTGKLRTGMTALLVDIIFLYRLLRHPKTPWYARGLLFLPVIYLCSPIQLIPNFIPVLGQMDDVFVIWVTKKVARNLVDEKSWRECHSAAAATRLPFSKQTAVSLDNKRI